jgi:hypothetical protein
MKLKGSRDNKENLPEKRKDRIILLNTSLLSENPLTKSNDNFEKYNSRNILDLNNEQSFENVSLNRRCNSLEFFEGRKVWKAETN